jgi:hypothetical protein
VMPRSPHILFRSPMPSSFFRSFSVVEAETICQPTMTPFAMPGTYGVRPRTARYARSRL